MSLIIVNIADAKFSKTAGETLITYSLGSCLGVSFYDPKLKIGAMIHIMLPDSNLESGKDFNPYKYVSTGIPKVYEKLISMGVRKERMIVKVAGGAQILDRNGFFNIGKRNYEALKNMFDKEYHLRISGRDIGGVINRTVSLEISTGRLRIKRNSREVIEI